MNNSIEICRSVAGIAFRTRRLRAQGLKVGFVPTMGALHEGHASLLKAAFEQSDVVVCSLYPNPTQFDNKEDLKKYPRTEEEDLELLQREKVALAYIPNTADIYHNLEVTPIDYGRLTNSLEGAHRPGHFDGMSTIVRRLLEIVTPDLAFFGEKDWQQLAIINHMNSTEGLGVSIISCPIIREPSGLAMSSRNRRLLEEEVLRALAISELVMTASAWSKTMSPSQIQAKGEELLVAAGLQVDYVSVVNAKSFEFTEEFNTAQSYRILIAAYCGDVRLIDNGAI
ncbi:MAG: pantoate--beta-alanine ligase [Flavobacteriales bacterium]